MALGLDPNGKSLHVWTVEILTHVVGDTSQDFSQPKEQFST